jgi:hypothetical protein
MTINQVALANTFNEFRVEFNNSANIINSLQDGTGNSNVNFLTVSGQVSSNLIPSANITYDLGSLNNRWKDLYLSGNSIFIGDATISYDGTTFKVVVGSDEIFTADDTGASVVESTTANTITANSITVNEDLLVSGNLTVNGTETILNVQTLNVEDKNITIANGAVDSAAADGAGITIDGAGASLIYTNAEDKFEFNRNVDVGSNTLTVTNPPAEANQVSNKAYTDSTAILYAIVL